MYMRKSWAQPLTYTVLVSLLLPLVCYDYLLVANVSGLKNWQCQITLTDLVLQVVKAFVVLSAAFSSSDREHLACELQEHVKKTTAPYKYPRKVNVSVEKLN